MTATFSFADQPEWRSTSSVCQLNGPSQLGQLAESADRFSTFEEKIYSVIKSSFDTKYLNFSSQRGSAVPMASHSSKHHHIWWSSWRLLRIYSRIIHSNHHYLHSGNSWLQFDIWGCQPSRGGSFWGWLRGENFTSKSGPSTLWRIKLTRTKTTLSMFR